VAAGAGSRPLGGVVLVIAGVLCARLWAPRGRRTMWALAGVYTGAFVVSHLLALAVGAWPSVLTVAVLTAAADLRMGAVDREPARSSTG
jgi:hypothetical protein